MMIKLEVHICDQRRSYLATFATEDQALAFMDRKYSFRRANGLGNYVLSELEEEPVPAEAARVLDRLYPTCEHGLALSNCNGPQHYWFDEEEQARGLHNS